MSGVELHPEEGAIKSVGIRQTPPAHVLDVLAQHDGQTIELWHDGSVEVVYSPERSRKSNKALKNHVAGIIEEHTDQHVQIEEHEGVVTVDGLRSLFEHLEGAPGQFADAS